jgi:hypothetical protein
LTLTEKYTFFNSETGPKSRLLEVQYISQNAGFVQDPPPPPNVTKIKRRDTKVTVYGPTETTVKGINLTVQP